MNSLSDNIEIMINKKADEVIEEIFQSFLSKYQIISETLIKDRHFILDCVHLLHYKCCKISFKRGGSNKYSPDWIKIKKY